MSGPSLSEQLRAGTQGKKKRPSPPRASIKKASEAAGGNMPLILKGFMCQREAKTNAEAAAMLGLTESSFRGYLAGNPLPDLTQTKMLSHMGASTMQEAALRYDRVTERVEIIPNFLESSERIFIRDGSRIRLSRSCGSDSRS